jgi:hypothetical protein
MVICSQASSRKSEVSETTGEVKAKEHLHQDPYITSHPSIATQERILPNPHDPRRHDCKDMEACATFAGTSFGQRSRVVDVAESRPRLSIYVTQGSDIHTTTPLHPAKKKTNSSINTLALASISYAVQGECLHKSGTLIHERRVGAD